MEQEPGVERLFEEREWVGALAERLCADAATAADLAQDTWVEALRTGGAARATRGWLGSVLRNLVARRRTRDAARGERERATARPEAVPGPDELLARAELQRRVLAAVANIPESYRSIVLLRHYEGLSAEEIARRSGESGSTVRNRLARAHALLRERLDRDYGERSLWSGLFVPASWTSAHKLGIGGALVGWKLHGGVAAVVLLAALWWTRGSDPAGLPHTEAQESAAPRVAAGPSLEASQATDSVHSANEPQRQAVAGPAPVREVLLLGELIGVPEPSGTMVLVDTHGNARRATLHGPSFTVPGLAPGTWRAVLQVEGCAFVDEEFSLDGARTTERKDFQLVPLRSVRVSFVDAQSGRLLSNDGVGELGRCLSAVATRSSSLRLGGMQQSMLRDSECSRYLEATASGASAGAGEPFSGTLELLSELPLWVHAVLRERVVASEFLDGSSTELVFRIDPQELERHAGALAVRCVDALTGQALVGVHVEVDFEDSGGPRELTDATGLARFERLAPGTRRVSAWGANRPMITRVVSIEAGSVREIEVAVAPPARVAGGVLGPDGGGLEASLELLDLEDERPAWWSELARSETDARGQFDVPFLRAGHWRLVVRAPGLALAALEVDLTLGEALDLTVQLERGTEVALLAPRSDFRRLEVVLVDARGGWLSRRRIHPSLPFRWTLSKGEYGLQVFAGDQLVESRALQVGTEPLSIQLGAR